jgi:hypothetical protein
MRVHEYFVFRQTVCVQLNFNPVKFCPPLRFTFIFNRCHNEVNINKRLYESLNCSASKPVLRREVRYMSCIMWSIRQSSECVKDLNRNKWEGMNWPVNTGGKKIYTHLCQLGLILKKHLKYILNLLAIWVYLDIIHIFLFLNPRW